MRLAVNAFLELERRLTESHPSKVAEAHDLAAQVVDVKLSNSETVWPVLWNKPLFANMRVDPAKRWCELLTPYMAGAWSVWGNDSKRFLITKTGKGTARATFTTTGDTAEEIVRNTGIALHRLYAIQGAAIATLRRSEVSETPYRDLEDMDLAYAVFQLQREFGFGWGPITVLHFLTDLGLAVKPDLHLMRTVRFLSDDCVAGGESAPSFDEALEVNVAVRNLLNDLGRDATPANLRYLDKVLMEISRCNVIESFQADYEIGSIQTM